MHCGYARHLSPTSLMHVSDSMQKGMHAPLIMKLQQSNILF